MTGGNESTEYRVDRCEELVAHVIREAIAKEGPSYLTTPCAAYWLKGEVERAWSLVSDTPFTPTPCQPHPA